MEEISKRYVEDKYKDHRKNMIIKTEQDVIEKQKNFVALS